jgi:hypothetical protein
MSALTAEPMGEGEPVFEFGFEGARVRVVRGAWCVPQDQYARPASLSNTNSNSNSNSSAICSRCD